MSWALCLPYSCFFFVKLFLPGFLFQRWIQFCSILWHSNPDAFFAFHRENKKSFQQLSQVVGVVKLGRKGQAKVRAAYVVTHERVKVLVAAGRKQKEDTDKAGMYVCVTVHYTSYAYF